MRTIAGTTWPVDEARKYIEDRVMIVPWSGCWLWEQSLTRKGYGNAHGGGRTMVAHRLAYDAFVGTVPRGSMVCHRCDVRSCCNPDHLFIGSAADNNADRDRKGRHKPLRGEENGSAKLTLDDVVAIRRSQISCRALGAVYGVNPSTVSLIRQNKTWRVALTDDGRDNGDDVPHTADRA